MVHAFTSTGLTETQYHSFGEAAGIGSVMDRSIDTSESFSMTLHTVDHVKFLSDFFYLDWLMLFEKTNSGNWDTGSLASYTCVQIT